MWTAVVAFVKRHPTLCAICALALVALGYRAQAKKATAQRNRARFDQKDAVHKERIEQAQARAEKAKRKGDAIAERRAEIDQEYEEKLRDEEKRHHTEMERINTESDDVSDADFIGERIRRGAARNKEGGGGSSGRNISNNSGDGQSP